MNENESIAFTIVLRSDETGERLYLRPEAWLDLVGADAVATIAEEAAAQATQYAELARKARSEEGAARRQKVLHLVKPASDD